MAVKLFRLDLAPERVHRLVAELESLVSADLAHPGIAAPLSAGLVGVSAYLVQDFVAADSLDVAIRDSGAFSPAAAARTARQLGSALDFAASADIAHGALHPRDVLLSADDARITGLGVARALERVGVATPVRRPYSAPERIKGASWNQRADVFSLAALMFELLWARRVSGVGEQTVEAIPDGARSDRAALKRVFVQALAENPAHRFETAGAFAEALQTAIEEMQTAPPSRADRRRTAPAADPTDARLPLDLSNFDLDEILRAERVNAPRVSNGDNLDLRVEEPPLADQPLPTAGVSAAPAPPVQASTVRDNKEVTPSMSIPSEAAFERTRSAVWPLVLALVVGIAIGFGIAMAFVARSPTTETAQQNAPQPQAPAVASSGPVAESSAPPAPSITAQPAPPVALAPAAAPGAPSSTPAPATTPAAAAPLQAPVPSRPQPAAPAPVAGTVVVRSTPPGAQIFLDGKRAGTTPATLSDLAPGPHAIRLAREGYVTVERQVSVSANRLSQSVTVQLARPRVETRVATVAQQAQTGAISVDSRPTGASVFIDGKLVGTTPLVVEAVAAGEHSVRLELGTFRPWSAPVSVVGGQRSRVAGSLEQEP